MLSENIRSVALSFALIVVALQPLRAQYVLTDFAPKLKGNARTTGHVIQNDGKLVLYGDYAFAGQAVVKGIVRLNIDGSIDQSFSLSDDLISIYLNPELSSGKHAWVEPGQNSDLVVGTHTTPRVVTVIDSIGHVKREIPVPLQYFQIDYLKAFQDGYLVVAMTGSSRGVFKTFENGNVDPEFIPFEFTGHAYDVQIDSGNNILLLGDITHNGVTTNMIKLQTNGEKDDTFNLLTFSESQTKFTLLPDKRILLAGRFDMINDVSYPYGLALLDQNGNVDPSFSGTALSTVIDAEAFQKVFDAAFDPTLNRVAVIVRDTLQQTAIVGVELDGTLSSEFSKIVLSENFLSQHTLSYGNGRFIYSMDFGATYEGVLYTFLAFDGSGTVDTSVSGNERLFGAGVVNTAVELDGGDIIIGGSFTHVDNIEVKNLARLNASGQPDQVFNSNNPLAVDDVVEKLEIDQNGDIYLGGMFRNILGQPKVPLLRMSDAGVLDESFVVHLFSLGSEVFLKDFILMDDRIIFCGQFSNYVQAVDKSGVLISDFITSLFPGVAAQVFSLCTIDQDNFAMSGAVNNVAAFLWAMDKNGNYNQNYLRQDSIDFSPNDIVKIGDALYNSGKLTHGGSDDGNVVYKYDLQTGDIIETGLSTFYSPGLSDNRHLLAINDSTVLLSGNFKKLNNVAVNDLAGSSLDGSVNERWLFNVSPDALEYSVNKTHLLSGNRVLAMGRFKSIEGLPAYSLAMLSAENFEPVVSYEPTITVNEDTTFNLFDYITIVDLDDEASITVFDNEHFEVGSSGMLSLASNYFGTTQIEFEVSDPLTTVGPFEITLNVQSVDDALGIFDREKQSAVSVFPNPAAESFSISSMEKILRVTVFSLNGARVRNVRFEKTSNSDYLVRLNGVHQGAYIVRAELESGQTVESRLIVD